MLMSSEILQVVVDTSHQLWEIPELIWHLVFIIKSEQIITVYYSLGNNYNKCKKWTLDLVHNKILFIPVPQVSW